jgi:hypothetical protein
VFICISSFAAFFENARFFSYFGRNFFQQFAEKPFWGLALMLEADISSLTRRRKEADKTVTKFRMRRES